MIELRSLKCWMNDSLQSVSSRSGSDGISGSPASPADWVMCRIASRSSASLDPNCRKIVISFTPAASAIRRVVEPRKPCCAKTSAAAARISSLRFMELILMTAHSGMQVVTCLHNRFYKDLEEDHLANPADLEGAFDTALRHVQRSISSGMNA